MANFCHQCGSNLSDNSAFCASCGSSVTASGASGGSGGTATRTARAEERTILQRGDVTVTTARFLVGSHTYAMSGITSVQTGVTRPSRVGPILLILFGVIGMLTITTGAPVQVLVVALICIVLGILWLRSKKPVYHVLLRSASGEAKACSSKVSDDVNSIVAALNEAIVLRG